jgi:AcrR family transcriptional regulator
MSRPVRISRKTQRERSAALILAAARELFARQGYQQVTMRGLSAATGLSTGAMVKRFATKADLWRAAMGCEPPDDPSLRRTAALEAALGRLAAALRAGGPGIERAVMAAEALLGATDAEANAETVHERPRDTDPT